MNKGADKKQSCQTQDDSNTLQPAHDLSPQPIFTIIIGETAEKNKFANEAAIKGTHVFDYQMALFSFDKNGTQKPAPNYRGGLCTYSESKTYQVISMSSSSLQIMKGSFASMSSILNLPLLELSRSYQEPVQISVPFSSSQWPLLLP